MSTESFTKTTWPSPKPNIAPPGCRLENGWSWARASTLWLAPPRKKVGSLIGEFMVNTDRVGLTGWSAIATLPPPQYHGAYPSGADGVLLCVVRLSLVAFAMPPVTIAR